MPIAYLSRRSVFSASHRLHAASLSEQENQFLFGKCNGTNGHGHNYVLEVTVRAAIDARTGLVMNLVDLKDAIDATVMKEMDHKHLNLDVPAFKTLNPTVENMAVVIWKMLEAKLPRGALYEVKLHETENNVAVYRGE